MKSIFIRLLALALTVSLSIPLTSPALAAETGFSDVPATHWAADAIAEAYNDNVMTGVENGVFDPDGKVTLVQFIAILTRAFYSSEVETSTASGAWYSKNYDAANRHHLFDGVINKQDSSELVREDMAQLMYNIMVDQGVEFPDMQKFQATKDSIPDFDAVTVSTGNAVAVCYSLGLISGIDAQGSFAPKEQMTRAQTAVVYTRLKQTMRNSPSAKPEVPENLPEVDFSAEYMSGPYYRALQEVVLTGDYRQDIIAVASSQIGYGEGDAENQIDGSYHGSGDYTEYGRYLGSNGSAWCSEFASWCARAAKIPTDILNSSKGANVEKFGAPYYAWSQSVYAGGTYTPRPGDLALFAWHGTSPTKKNLSHTAIVYDAEISGNSVKITVIHGNSNNSAAMSTYTTDASTGEVKKGYLVYFVAPEYELQD